MIYCAPRKLAACVGIRLSVQFHFIMHKVNVYLVRKCRRRGRYITYYAFAVYSTLKLPYLLVCVPRYAKDTKYGYL